MQYIKGQKEDVIHIYQYADDTVISKSANSLEIAKQETLWLYNTTVIKAKIKSELKEFIN